MVVSVILPVKDDIFLKEAKDSIRGNYVELIQIDDPDRKGPAWARNRGLEIARGEYIMFCDSDDLMEPGAIDLMVQAMNGVDMVCGSFRKFGDFEMTVTHPMKILKMHEVAEYAMRNLQDPGKNQMLSGCWAKMFRRELIRPFPNLMTAEDMAFNFDYLRRCGLVKFLPDIVYHNRKRQGSLTTTFDEKNKPALFGFLGGLKYVKKFLKPYYLEDEIEDALDSSKLYHSLLYFTRIAGCGRETFRRLYS